MFGIIIITSLAAGGATFVTPEGDRVFCKSVYHTNGNNLYFIGCNDGNDYYLMVKELKEDE